jgi:DNA-binding response OmpR family regulator
MYSLRAAGFEVRAFSDSEQAARAALQLAPSVIVTRIGQLHSFDFVELTRRLREQNATPRIPIVIMTTSIRREDRRAARQAGCNSYLQLPCLPDELVAEVRRLTGADSGPRDVGRGHGGRGHLDRDEDEDEDSKRSRSE